MESNSLPNQLKTSRFLLRMCSIQMLGTCLLVLWSECKDYRFIHHARCLYFDRYEDVVTFASYTHHLINVDIPVMFVLCIICAFTTCAIFKDKTL